MSSRPHFLEPLLKAGDAKYRLINERTGLVIASNVELAADSRSRNRGLLGRSSLAPDSALIIAPCNAVHTFFMRFSIDVIFVSRLGLVVKVCPGLRPWRIGLGLGGFAAVELAAGAANLAEIGRNDRILVVQS